MKMKTDSPDQFKLARQMETLRSDERGSLTLLAGMMVFLVTIFAIIAFDTNKAIYNRIVAQNAVDAAADSAALWQARFCNVEQQLNNLHYTVDEAMCIAEGISIVMCGASVPLEVVQNIPLCDPEAVAAYDASCVLCDFLPAEDHAQHLFYDALIGRSYSLQEIIADAAPFLVFANANACAYGSGANNVFDSAVQTGGEYITDAVSAIPGADASSIQGAMTNIDNVIGSTLGQIPIYAIPLNPMAMLLDVNPTNNGQLPEDWPASAPYAGNVLGVAGCEEFEYPYEEAAGDVSYDPNGGQDSTGDESRLPSPSPDQYHPSWGWNDQYEYGNPGFMTWIAGTTNAPEILGLGNLVWLNSSPNSTIEPTNMYTGPVTGSGGLTIPAYIAIASSQVEGTTVVCDGTPNAVPQLIRVCIPEGMTNYEYGTSLPFPFTIYH